MKTILSFCLCALSFSFYAQVSKAPVKVLVKGFDGKPYVNDKVTFIGQKSKQKLSGITNSTGQFVVQLPCGEIYDIRIQSIGDEIEYNTLEIPSAKPGEYFEEAELVIEYDPGSVFSFTNLQFETGKSDLKPISYGALNNLVEIMKRKKEIKIQIDGHTDSDGDNQANQQLSQKRAESVRNYLISKGIDATRVKAKGNGESKPIADNNTAQGKAQNRRTEITIL
ncbi:OmpA family protein [Fluviicola taffensis]|uniref:OmpA/MotB domain protein n=1 Tax=Fluviicola taffensis (strain DSM 16823 / NCIMB 13979 / RW262) TaxID=755732 RepID=F2IGQ6_FLUTR|nr:OmpA family protein [Fluviicola taffensis]AEA43673.1 OmpA/MotB domain protein [Fluviicola taffensis DSM 16823]